MASSGTAFQQSGVTSISASTSSAQAMLVGAGNADTAIVSNTTTATAWVLFGSAAQSLTAAAGTGYPVLPGTQRAIAVTSFVSSAACILSAGTGSVYIELGNGSGH